MKAVKFLLSHTLGTLYRPGEEATFDDAIADELIALKIAEKIPMEKGAKKANAPTPTDAERAAAALVAAQTLSQKEKEALSGTEEVELDKIITDEQIEGVAVDATKEDKIAAIIAARVPTIQPDGGKSELEKLTVAALDKIIADEDLSVDSGLNKADKVNAIVEARTRD